MNNQKDLEIDLLRNRRLDLGIVDTNIFISERKLLKKGYLIGSGIISLVMGIFLFLIISQKVVQSKKTKLEPTVQEYESTQSKLFQTNKLNSDIKNSNIALAKEIIKIGSYSALITETSKIIPQSIQLENVKFKKGGISFNANVDNDLGLYEIIAFKLNLQNSIFFKKNSVTLKQASQQTTNTNYGFRLKKLNFSIDADIERDPLVLYGKNINTENLRSLKSKGLAERIELIKQEDILWQIFKKTTPKRTSF